MRVLITGAHFTTAVAVIEQLQNLPAGRQGIPSSEIVYVGRSTTLEGDKSKSIESEVLPTYGVKFISIITGRLQRSFTIYTIPSLLKIPIGFIQSFYILMKEKPDVILSFGGYVAVSLVIVGWVLSIPIIIHEQTLVTGLANRISSWFASKIAVSFDVKNNFDPKKVILTGNPLRKEITDVNFKMGYDGMFKSARKEKLPIIFVTGGNQGSHAINLAVEDCLDDLQKIAFVVHQTGDSKFKDFERLKQKENDRYLVKKWFDNVAEIFKKSDLVVSRAGINTLTEISFLGIPALVVPIPYLYQDEQNKNAEFFAELGSVKILPQSKLSGKSLLENIKNGLSDSSFKKQAQQAKKVLVPDAAKRLALETILVGRA